MILIFKFYFIKIHALYELNSFSLQNFTKKYINFFCFLLNFFSNLKTNYIKAFLPYKLKFHNEILNNTNKFKTKNQTKPFLVLQIITIINRPESYLNN
ncbi:hypothetical protein BpHYR1_016485 [Brachionus plicatilis]|uniref:Uncharacterized protein n=1 Tax=Brachionus plicatilis TaxID=10195 RepID=A0A3M7T527_BRAPC|nr:hypothetical protein BpHYR1_016485 [Brachionus plicatilis]